MNQSQEQLETLLSDYVEGNLAGEELAALEKYLESNPGLRDTVNRMMIDSEAIRSLPRIAAPFDFSEAVRGQFERDLLLDDAMTAYPRRRRISSLLASVAAMLLLFVGVGAMAYWILANRPAPYLDVAMNSPTSHDAAQDESQGKSRDKLDSVEGPPPSAKVAPDAFADRSPAQALPGAGRPDVKATDPDAAGILSAARRLQINAPAPSEVKELIDESPRYNRRARAIVIDAKDAAPANRALQNFMATHTVRTENLAFDAARNRAVRQGASGGLADSTPVQSPNLQVSGVTSNSAAALGAQELARNASIQENAPHTQVLLAYDMTEAQADDLQASLQSNLAAATAYELGVEDPTARENDGSAGGTGPVAKTEAEVVPATSTSTPTHTAQPVPSSQPALLAIGDRLLITLVDPDASNLKTQREVSIDSNGMIQLPMLDAIHAADMTIVALRRSIADEYVTKKLMSQPIIDIERPARFEVTSSNDAQQQAANGDRTDLEKAVGERDELKSKGLVKEHGDAGLFDVYLIVRGQAAPTTQPIAPPTTQPQ